MSLPVAGTRITTMAPAAVDQVRQLEAVMLAGDGIEIPTTHVLHAGLYSRTIRLPGGFVLTGAFIKIPTQLILNGHASVFIGGEAVELAGHHVIAASAGRKQVFYAHSDTHLTMVFPTKAGSVAEAEAEFTDEVDLLVSRRCEGIDTVIITGE